MPVSTLRNLTSHKTLWFLLFITLCLPLHGGFSKAVAAETVALPQQTVATGEAALTVSLELPAGHKLNQEAPSTIGVKSGDKKIVALDEKYAQDLPAANLPLCLTLPVQEGKTTLQANYRLNFCDEKLGVCFFKEVQLTLPVEVNKSATNKKLEMTYKIKSN